MCIGGQWPHSQTPASAGHVGAVSSCQPCHFAEIFPLESEQPRMFDGTLSPAPGTEPPRLPGLLRRRASFGAVPTGGCSQVGAEAGGGHSGPLEGRELAGAGVEACGPG